MSGTVKIHGKEYKTVALRVQEFREKHSDFTIQTELVEANDTLVIVKATIAVAGQVISTGYAEEVRSASKINRTSALENAETSAVGRALAFFGMGGSEIASADEVANAISQQNSQPAIEETNRLIAHNEAWRNNSSSIYFIKEHIELKSWEAVAEAWAEISNEDKATLWLAPSKGGVFTTAERAALKSDEFNAARKVMGENDG
jgi:deoxycytidylate deaminase